MKRLFPLLLSGALILLADKPDKHWHDDEKHFEKHQKDNDDRDGDHDGANCRFQPRDVRIISDYYGPQYRNLPPGLQKKYARTGQLPPGWQQRFRPLPPDIDRRLAPIPQGYQRGVVDGYAVVYNPITQIIMDITRIIGR